MLLNAFRTLDYTFCKSRLGIDEYSGHFSDTSESNNEADLPFPTLISVIITIKRREISSFNILNFL